MNTVIHKANITGSTVLGHIDNRHGKTPKVFRDNAIVRDWSTIFANLLVSGESRYRVATVYLEYSNEATADSAVSLPPLDTEQGIEYYNGLASDSQRDYLRLFTTSSSVVSSDAELRPNGDSSQFFAMSSGGTGVHGKPFSSQNNSTVYGAALVVSRDANDATQDLILSRVYYPAEEQQIKLPTSEICIDWLIEFV